MLRQYDEKREQLPGSSLCHLDLTRRACPASTSGTAISSQHWQPLQLVSMSHSSSLSCPGNEDWGDLELSDSSGSREFSLPDGRPLPFGAIVDRWRLVAKLGRGGFSFCYLAENRHNNKLPLTALKIGDVLSSQDQNDWSWINFCQEIQMFTRLSSTADGTPASCIPQIYASGIVESAEGLRPWICMERLGEDLYCATWYTAKERHELEGLDRKAAKWPGRGFPEPQLLQYATLMLRALQHVHKQQVVHRDVKPANFCLPFKQTRASTASQIFLIDFGLSHDVPAKESHQPFFGTPDYASSACLHERQAFPKDDLESLVYTLTELWNGELPWDLEADIGIKNRGGGSNGWTPQQLLAMSSARNCQWDQLLLQDSMPRWLLWLHRYIKSLRCSDPISYEYCIMMLMAFQELEGSPLDPEE
ncbi:hypothetical protein WJX84_001861 [Apatococcus fuscideae]|uniref:non-specific serine/threonine protein kinase n=1 Tax=Apatococcus fuscideae TaxID=2026836 RepID=A0AAW1T510_9CHLO